MIVGLIIVMEELEKLESLSLVSKICTELENHLGMNDKDLGMMWALYWKNSFSLRFIHSGVYYPFGRKVQFCWEVSKEIVGKWSRLSSKTGSQYTLHQRELSS